MQAVEVGNGTTCAAYQRGVTCLGRLGPAVSVMESVELWGRKG